MERGDAEMAAGGRWARWLEGTVPPGVGGSATERRLFDENGMNKIVAGGFKMGCNEIFQGVRWCFIVD